jgi:cytochrome c5
MNSKHLLLTLVVLTSFAALARAASQNQQNQPQAAPQNKTHAATPATQPHEDEGTRIFQQNCSRCHNTPEGFSPRISGTIVRHMRVRASLSQHDAEELLRFFNP